MVQLCAEDDKGESTESLHDWHVEDLKATAHVLEAAVSTVVASAAAQTGQQAPSAELLDACFDVVRDLLGAFMVQNVCKGMDDCKTERHCCSLCKAMAPLMQCSYIRARVLLLNTGQLSQYSATYASGEGMPLLQVRAISAGTVPSCVDIMAHKQVMTLS